MAAGLARVPPARLAGVTLTRLTRLPPAGLAGVTLRRVPARRPPGHPGLALGDAAPGGGPATARRPRAGLGADDAVLRDEVQVGRAALLGAV